MKDFDGDSRVEMHMRRTVNHTHSATPEHAFNPIASVESLSEDGIDHHEALTALRTERQRKVENALTCPTFLSFKGIHQRLTSLS